MTPETGGSRSETDVTKLDDEVKSCILALLEMAEREDEFVRLQQMKLFKRNNLFWHGFQYLFWSDADVDWRIPTHDQFMEMQSREEHELIYSYVINIYKAHGESIIAALSADIPTVQFGPRDAQDPNDRRAVEAADNCVELIEKWNRAKLLIINALFFLANEGFVASYTYNKKDEEFGTVKIPEYSLRMEQTSADMLSCPNCGYEEPAAGASSPQMQQMQPPQLGQPQTPSGAAEPSSGVEPQGELGGLGGNVQPMNEPAIAPVQNQNVCPQCGGQMQLEPGIQEEVPFMSGERPIPKGREIVEIYGALNVRVPSYVSKQADAGYLIHYVDAHPAMFKDAFPDVAEDIDIDPGQDYGRMMRQSALSMEGYQASVRLATQKRAWFRPWMFQALDQTHDESVKWLKKTFSAGMYTSVIGETICELRNESMDKHWTITKAGPSKGVHADPLLQSLVPIQELTNNLENLMVMQVEYGVPATYADTEVYDFDGQSRQEISPGFVYPVTPRPGQSISDAFYTERTSTLAKEATEFKRSLEADAQFVVGDVPSIYGGASSGGSKTLGEYEKSRSFALQRLSIVWYFINVWWGETMHKALNSFIAHQIEDEPISSKNTANGMFQTKWIRQADMKGSFDRLDPEVSTDFPVSFAQKAQRLMSLLQLNKPQIDEVILSPENAGLVQQYTGLREFVVPSNIQRNKQIGEILTLIGMEPAEDAAGQMSSSVAIEPDIDDHEIHIDVLVDFLSSDTGQDLKASNPAAYANCLAHLMAHKQQQQMEAMQNAGPMGPAGPGMQGPQQMQPKGAPAPPRPQPEKNIA